MIWLLVASLLWGPSFGLVPILITEHGVDPYTLSVLRMFYALILFLPLLRPHKYSVSRRLSLVALGGLQYGVMYITLFASYIYLEGYEVALLTIFTPLYASLLDSLLGKEKPGFRPMVCVLLAVAGSAVIRYANPESAQFWTGFWILQLCNVSFAVGQVVYRRMMHHTLRFQDAHVFGWMFMGALAVSIAGWALLADPAPALRNLQGMRPSGWLIVLWLGLVPSGLAFFLFNHGALRVDAHSMAIANNLKIPIALLMALLIFRQGQDLVWARFLPGTALMIFALWWNHRPLRIR